MSMICQTRTLPRSVGNPDIRHPVPADAEAFGALLLDAYHGTADYEGEDLAASIEAARSFMSGEDFTPLWDACFAQMDDERMMAVSFVADFEDMPLLVVTATEKAVKRTGLASQLIELSLDALHHMGKPTLRLWVTCSNTPAVKAYRKLGFTPESS